MKELTKETRMDLLQYMILTEAFEKGKVDSQRYDVEREKLFNRNGGVQRFYDLVQLAGIDSDKPAPNQKYDTQLAARILKGFDLMGNSATDSKGLLSTGYEGKRYPLMMSLYPDHYLVESGIPQTLGMVRIPVVNSLAEAVDRLKAWRDFVPTAETIY